MMLNAGDIGMIASVCRNFLGWIFTKKEDRIALKTSASAPQLSDSVDPNDARNALHSLPVLEAPRTDASTAKLRHAGVKQATTDQASESMTM